MGASSDNPPPPRGGLLARLLRPASELRWVRWTFLRLLGAVYAIAFASYGVQALGLIGERGILPARLFLDGLGDDPGGFRAFWLAPSVLWLSPTDPVIQLVWMAGIALSILLIIGVAPRLVLALLFVGYLSLASADALFLNFQWDGLLLEVGFAAIVLAPGGWWPGVRRADPPPLLSVVLMRWILFRVYFQSAVVKVLAHTAYWRDFTAMTYHYETQPLPTVLGYWAYHLPTALHRVEVGATLVVEGLLALLIFAPRRPRLAAFVGLLGLQVLIGLTGNYGFFNLLTAALCLTLLDDRVLWRVLGRLMPRRLRARLDAAPVGPTEPGGRTGRPRHARLVVVSSISLVLGSLFVVESLSGRDSPGWLREVLYWTSRPHIVNGYGLFADMTTSRPEIILQGSRDGSSWESYRFRDKPDDRLDRRPGYVEPHMPRLDWQLWFAALYEDCRVRPARWFQSFARRILLGSPDVLALLESNPFGDQPPRYLRSLLYDYRFTTLAERAETGDWWRRERRDSPFCPILTLDERRRLRAVELVPADGSQATPAPGE